MLQLEPKSPHHKLHQWAEELGGLYALRLFTQNLIVVSDYDSIRYVLITKGKQFSGRPRGLLRLEMFSYDGEDISFADPDFPFWALVRKTVHKHIKMHGGGLSNTEEIITRFSEKAYEKITKTSGQPTDIRDILYNFTIETMLTFLLGNKFANDHEIKKVIVRMENNASSALNVTGKGAQLDTFPWLRFFGHKTYKEILAVREDLQHIWSHIKPQLESFIDVNQPRSVVEALLALKYKAKSSDGTPLIEDVNIMTAFNDLVLGGVSTTTCSLYAFINILLHYHDVTQKIYKEIVTVVGTKRKITVADRENLPYLRACLFELVRYATISTSGLAHTTTEDVPLSGSVIPKGTNVVINYWSLLHDKGFWGDPWVFRPGRFLTDEGHLLPADHLNRKHMMQFGAGPRVCLGELLAMTRMFLFLANLIQEFEFHLSPGVDPVSCDPRDYNVGLNLSPPDYQACFIRRH